MKNFWQWLKWPGGIILILVVGVAMNIGMVVMAVSNPSWALEENYYEKALRWDDKLKQDKQNRRLGWTPSLALTLKNKKSMQAQFCTTLKNKQGVVVDKAKVRLVAFANIRAANRQKVSLQETRAGVYCGSLNLHRLGLWEFRLVAVRGKDRFTFKKMRSVPFTRQ